MEAQSIGNLTVALRAQDAKAKENFEIPDNTDNFTLIRILGTFTVRDANDEPLSQPSAVRLMAFYTEDDVRQVPPGEKFLLGIHFPEQTILWASPEPENPTLAPLQGYRQGSGWFTFVIPNPEEGEPFTVDISGNFGDPVVGAGSG